MILNLQLIEEKSLINSLQYSHNETMFKRLTPKSLLLSKSRFVKLFSK